MAVNEKWILSNNRQWPAQWLNQQEVLKHFPKPNLHQKKVIVTVRWCAASLIHYSFLNPSEIINSEKYAHKSMRYTENANACSQHWSVEWFHFSTTPPDRTSHEQCFKSWMNWATKFCLIHHIHMTSRQLTDTSLSISKLFAGKMLPQPARGRKHFPRVRRILTHRF